MEGGFRLYPDGTIFRLSQSCQFVNLQLIRSSKGSKIQVYLSGIAAVVVSNLDLLTSSTGSLSLSCAASQVSRLSPAMREMPNR